MEEIRQIRTGTVMNGLKSEKDDYQNDSRRYRNAKTVVEKTGAVC